MRMIRMQSTNNARLHRYIYSQQVYVWKKNTMQCKITKSMKKLVLMVALAQHW